MERWAYLAFLFLDFVAAEVLFGLGEDNVFAEDRVVFLERKFIRGVHRVFLGIILTNAGFFGDEADEFALGVILLCHDCPLFYHILR